MRHPSSALTCSCFSCFQAQMEFTPTFLVLQLTHSRSWDFLAFIITWVNSYSKSHIYILLILFHWKTPTYRIALSIGLQWLKRSKKTARYSEIFLRKIFLQESPLLPFLTVHCHILSVSPPEHLLNLSCFVFITQPQCLGSTDTCLYPTPTCIKPLLRIHSANI